MSVTTTLRKQAQECFQSLLALDEHRGERQELLATGVSRHRVEALYGEEFEALLPGLMHHFDEHGLPFFFEEDALAKGGGHLTSIHQSMSRAKYAAANAAFVASAATHLSELHVHLRDANAETSAADIAKIARLIWWTHWCMSNRANILLQNEVDLLMIWVHENILDV